MLWGHDEGSLRGVFGAGVPGMGCDIFDGGVHVTAKETTREMKAAQNCWTSL